MLKSFWAGSKASISESKWSISSGARVGLGGTGMFVGVGVGASDPGAERLKYSFGGLKDLPLKSYKLQATS